jgi:hypothetical protein
MAGGDCQTGSLAQESELKVSREKGKYKHGLYAAIARLSRADIF